jgi:aminomethyltransferase
MTAMEGRHAFFCNSLGGIIDDVMVFRLDENELFIVVNAVNREKDLIWINENRGDFEVTTKDLTTQVPMMAVQGPEAPQTLKRIFSSEINEVTRLRSYWFNFGESKVLISRTGYTGEDGFEIYLFECADKEVALDLWNCILEAGKEFKIEACGLAARDTLRLEAGFCLYGNELNENVTPIEAGLKFGVVSDHRDFIGKEAILKQMTDGVNKTRIGLKMVGKGISRKGMQILKDNEEIGFVTSGTLSPILNIGIAMGYVPPDYASLGKKVDINIRGRLTEAELTNIPFYDKSRYGWKRLKS